MRARSSTSGNFIKYINKIRLQKKAVLKKEVARMKRFLLWLIRFYRKYLSGLKGYSTCKYYPTCSQYGLEAIEKYGAFKGGALAVWRILRCNPFSKGGYDPVP